jgi:hypothetical protein
MKESRLTFTKTKPSSHIPNINFFCLIFIGIQILTGCSSKKNKSIENTIEIPIDLDASIKGKYSEVFSSIEYILLDDPETNLLVNPYKLRFLQNRIYVQDIGTENFHSFNDQGEYIFSINSEGQGPSEFTRIEDFQVTDDSIFIFDRFLDKILQYNLEGKFIKESKAINQGTGFLKKEGKTLMYMDNRLDLSPYNFLLFEKTSRIEQNIPIRKGFETESQLLSNGFSLSPFDSGIYFNIPFTYEVAFFDPNLNFKRKLKFNLGKYEISDEFRSSFFGSRDRSKFDNIRKEKSLVENLSGFFDLGSYYALSIQQGGNKLHYFFLDRDFKVVYQFDQLINDIDGMTIKGIPWTSSNDQIVILINSISFYNNYLEVFSGKNITLQNKNVHSFFDSKKEKLKEDKTVLILLKVKKEINFR